MPARSQGRRPDRCRGRPGERHALGVYYVGPFLSVRAFGPCVWVPLRGPARAQWAPVREPRHTARALGGTASCLGCSARSRSVTVYSVGGSFRRVGKTCPRGPPRVESRRMQMRVSTSYLAQKGTK